METDDGGDEEPPTADVEVCLPPGSAGPYPHFENLTLTMFDSQHGKKIMMALSIRAGILN